jgi:hypothetical protein
MADDDDEQFTYEYNPQELVRDEEDRRALEVRLLDVSQCRYAGWSFCVVCCVLCAEARCRRAVSFALQINQASLLLSSLSPPVRAVLLCRARLWFCCFVFLIGPCRSSVASLPTRPQAMTPADRSVVLLERYEEEKGQKELEWLRQRRAEKEARPVTRILTIRLSHPSVVLCCAARV